MMSLLDLTKLRTVEVKAQEVIDAARALRDQKLRAFDADLYRNEIYWATLTESQRTERLAYRQLLLDLTEQPGFPVAIDWPVVPEVTNG